MLSLVRSLAEGELAEAKALKAKRPERLGGGRWSRASITALRRTAGGINPDSARIWRREAASSGAKGGSGVSL